MASKKTDDITEESVFQEELVAAGLSPEIAAQISAKAIENRRNKERSVKPEKAVSAVVEKKDESTFVEVDARKTPQVPRWIREVIETHLAIEAEDAKASGEIGYLARALVIATMPYRDPKKPDGTPAKDFSRVNGDFKLEILSSHGIPFGIYPRLLMSWVTTEAVQKQSPVIELGDSLRSFLRDVLDIRSASGGARGSGGRVLEQMKRLFGSLITAEYAGKKGGKGFALRNILIANELNLSHAAIKAIEDLDKSQNSSSPANKQLWTPQDASEAGNWQSELVLTDSFFMECVSSPVPVDLRAYKALRGSPLAMDIYSWMTYRVSYLKGATRPIPWEALMLQFGSGFTSGDADPTQAVRNFKKDFLKALKAVLIVYPSANITIEDSGLVLHPSPTHVPKAISGKRSQARLF